MMARLFKWFLGLTVAAAVLTGTTGGWSYVQTSQRLARQTLLDAVPVTFHLERLRQMVDDLVPEIQRNRIVVAESEVDQDELRRHIQDCRGQLSAAQAQILKERGMLQSPGEDFYVGGRRFSRSQVETDLAQRLDCYSAAEEAVAAKERLLAAREKGHDAARAKLGAYQRERQRLEVQVAQLDSQLKLMESTDGSHKVDLNQTKLAETQRLAEYLKRKLDVAQRVLEDAALAKTGINLGESPSRNVAQEVDRKFGSQPDGCLRPQWTNSR